MKELTDGEFKLVGKMIRVMLVISSEIFGFGMMCALMSIFVYAAGSSKPELMMPMAVVAMIVTPLVYHYSTRKRTAWFREDTINSKRAYDDLMRDKKQH